eukprot:6213307-Pleurochrysis_carterae.AAC.1
MMKNKLLEYELDAFIADGQPSRRVHNDQSRANFHFVLSRLAAKLAASRREITTGFTVPFRTKQHRRVHLVSTTFEGGLNQRGLGKEGIKE